MIENGPKLVQNWFKTGPKKVEIRKCSKIGIENPN